MSRHTRFNTNKKTESFAIRGIFFRSKYSLEVDIIDQYNYISHFYYTGNAEIIVIWNAIREFFIKKLKQFRWNPPQVTMLFPFPVNPHRGLDGFSTNSIVCRIMQHVIWQFLMHNY